MVLKGRVGGPTSLARVGPPGESYSSLFGGRTHRKMRRGRRDMIPAAMNTAEYENCPANCPPKNLAAEPDRLSAPMKQAYWVADVRLPTRDINRVPRHTI